MHNLIGLLVGTLLKVFVPYVRTVLEYIASTGRLEIRPKFDWRYLAMVLLPIMEFGVAFLTIPNLWETAMGWEFIVAVGLAYSGTDIGKEISKSASAIYRIVQK
jgi:hypothetical protein